MRRRGKFIAVRPGRVPVTHIKYILIIRYCNFLAVCSRKDGGFSSSVFFIFYCIDHPNHSRYHTDIFFIIPYQYHSSKFTHLAAIRHPGAVFAPGQTNGPGAAQSDRRNPFGSTRGQLVVREPFRYWCWWEMASSLSVTLVPASPA